jgi:hypothetical protein
MNTTVFWVSYLGLWAIVIALFAAVFFLYRYHGQLLLNTLEARQNQGPEINKPLPRDFVSELNGGKAEFDIPLDKFKFIFFASSKCGPCKKVIEEDLGIFAERYKDSVESVLICVGAPSEVDSFARLLPPSVTLVSNTKGDLFVRLRISSTPFALILDKNGVVKAKGMPDALNALEWFVEYAKRPSDIRAWELNSPELVSN